MRVGCALNGKTRLASKEKWMLLNCYRVNYFFLQLCLFKLREGGEKGRGNKTIKLIALFTNNRRTLWDILFIERLHSIDVFHNINANYLGCFYSELLRNNTRKKVNKTTWMTNIYYVWPMTVFNHYHIFVCLIIINVWVHVHLPLALWERKWPEYIFNILYA